MQPTNSLLVHDVCELGIKIKVTNTFAESFSVQADCQRWEEGAIVLLEFPRTAAVPPLDAVWGVRQLRGGPNHLAFQLESTARYYFG